MKLFSTLLLLSALCSPLHSDGWLPAPGIISGTNPSNTYWNFFTSPSPKPGQFLTTAIGLEGTIQEPLPYYAIFDTCTNTWTTPFSPQFASPVFPGSVISHTIYTSLGNGLNLATQAVSNPTSVAIYSTTFNGTIWTGPTLLTSIPQNLISDIFISDITNSFNPDLHIGTTTAGTFLAMWGETVSQKLPFSYPIHYATYDSLADTWSVPNTLPGTPRIFVAGNVYSAGGIIGTTPLFVATWVDSSSGIPSYATFDGLSWKPPAPISTVQIEPDVFCLFDSVRGKFLATWVDQFNFIPIYSYFDGVAWSAPTPITGATSINTANLGTVSTSIDPVTGNILATWNGHSPTSNGPPQYAIYDGSSWLPMGSNTIPGSGSNSTPSDSAFFPFSAFDSTNKEFIATWLDLNGNGIYDIFSESAKKIPTITVTAAPNPSKFTQTIIIKAKVSGCTTPTGRVVFYAGSKKLGSAILNGNGIATLKTCQLPRGTTTITATYLGNATYTSRSASTPHTVL